MNLVNNMMKFLVISILYMLYKQNILEAGKPILNFDDDIYYVNLSNQLHITSINNNFYLGCTNI